MRRKPNSKASVVASTCRAGQTVEQRPTAWSINVAVCHKYW